MKRSIFAAMCLACISGQAFAGSDCPKYATAYYAAAKKFELAQFEFVISLTMFALFPGGSGHGDGSMRKLFSAEAELKQSYEPLRSSCRGDELQAIIKIVGFQPRHASEDLAQIVIDNSWSENLQRERGARHDDRSHRGHH